MKFDIVESIKKIDIRYKVTFLSTVIFGILSQGMGIFNKYSYSDDVGDLFTLGATVTSGRWMLELLSKIELFIFGDGTFSMPVINGFMSILYIGIAACVIVSLLEIKSKNLCICLGGIMVVFPTITGMFGVMFTVPSYMLGMLMGVVGTYLVCKNNNWIIVIGILLMACSVGVYQAFIPLIIGLFVIYLIKYCIDNFDKTKIIIFEIVKSIVTIISFMVVYFVINKIVLSLCNAELTSYQGINTVGKVSLKDYLLRIVYAYGRFFILNSKSQYYMYYGNIVYVYYTIIVIIAILGIITFVNIYRTNRINAFILLILFACVPLASNFIFVMVDSGYVHALMVYGQIVPFILLALLIDNSEINNSIIKYLSTIGTIALLAINIMYCRFDNQCYLKATFSQQESISYFTTLVTRIKSTERYDDELPVSFVFIDGQHIEDKSIYILEGLDYIRVIPYDNQFDYVNNYVWQVYMKRWCGYSPIVVDGSDLENNDEVKQMTCYPDDGSIKVVDNRVVVRFR